LEGIAALITATALLLTSLTGIALQLRQSKKADAGRAEILQKADDVHTIVNSQRTEMIARIEQLEGFIRRRDDERDNTPPPSRYPAIEPES
jgi:hypothetical protein